MLLPAVKVIKAPLTTQTPSVGQRRQREEATHQQTQKNGNILRMSPIILFRHKDNALVQSCFSFN